MVADNATAAQNKENLKAVTLRHMDAAQFLEHVASLLDEDQYPAEVRELRERAQDIGWGGLTLKCR